MFHPKNSPGRIFSFSLPARPEAQSALQGQGTGLARWWGHEVLKGPIPWRTSSFHSVGNTETGASGSPIFPFHISTARPTVVHGSCKVSAAADAPTTVLAPGPPPLTGRTGAVRTTCFFFIQRPAKAGQPSA